LVLSLGLGLVGLLAAGPAQAQVAEFDSGPDYIWDLQTDDPGVVHTGNLRTLVFDLEEHNGRVYAAGKFLEARSAGGAVVSRPYLAAFDVHTGALITSFAPQLDGAAYSIEFAPDGRMFVGGEFTGGMALLNATTGARDTGFNPNISNSWGSPAVWDIEIEGNRIYLGGSFDRIGSTVYGNLARYTLSTLALDPTWKPMSDGGLTNERGAGKMVWNMAVDTGRGRVYIVGKFDMINGNTDADNFATLNTTNGNIIPSLPLGSPLYTLNHEDCEPGQAIPAECNPFDMWYYDVQFDGDKVWIGGQAHQTVMMNAADLSPIKFSFTNRGLDDVSSGGDTQVLFVGKNTVWSGCHCWGSVAVYDPLSTRMFRNPYSTFVANFATVDNQSVRGQFGMDRVTGALSPQQFDLTGQSGAYAILEDSNGRLWIGGQYQSGGGRGLTGMARFTPLGGVDVKAPVACTVAEVNGSVRVSWSRAANDAAANFIVRRNRDGAGLSWSARVSAPTVSWTDGNVVAGSTYGYTVESRQGNTVSAGTTCSPNPITFGAGAQAVAPSACTVLSSDGQVTVSWTRAASDNATNFVVRRQRNAGSFFWSAKRPAPSTTWTDTNVAVGGSYSYTVETLAGSDRSATRTCAPSPIVVVDAGNAAPLAPVNCAAVAQANGSVRVSWNRAGNDSADDFVIRRSRNGGASYWTARTAVSPWTNTGLSSGTYRYTVEALNNAGRSAPVSCSPTDGVVVGGAAAVPVKPIACWATRVSATEVRVTWTKAANDVAADYVIRRSRNGGTYYWAGTSTATPWNNTGMGTGTYRYQVQSRNASGTSALHTCGPNSGVTL